MCVLVYLCPVFPTDIKIHGCLSSLCEKIMVFTYITYRYLPMYSKSSLDYS